MHFYLSAGTGGLEISMQQQRDIGVDQFDVAALKAWIIQLRDQLAMGLRRALKLASQSAYAFIQVPVA